MNNIHLILNVNEVVILKVHGRVSLFVGWITLFLIGIDLFVVSPLMPFISRAYQTSPAMTGWMITVFAITYAIFAPFLGGCQINMDGGIHHIWVSVVRRF